MDYQKQLDRAVKEVDKDLLVAENHQGRLTVYCKVPECKWRLKIFHTPPFVTPKQLQKLLRRVDNRDMDFDRDVMAGGDYAERKEREGDQYVLREKLREAKNYIQRKRLLFD